MSHAVKKYLDWKGYLEGFYLSWVKSLASTFLALIGSNSAAQIPGMHSIGLTWRQAGTVFLSITVWEIATYLKTKPKPETITQEVTEQQDQTP